jgi:acyl-coenzyme A thioesterase PaaI-like protein
VTAGPPPDGEVVDDGRCFACGPHNPIGLKLRFAPSADGVQSEIVIAEPFQGWRGIVHGGIVMTLLDEGMAHAAGAAGYRGVTAELSTRFRAPVPIGAPLLVTGRVAWRRGRVFGLEASVLGVDGTVLAQGTGKFVERGALAPGVTLGDPADE